MGAAAVLASVRARMDGVWLGGTHINVDRTQGCGGTTSYRTGGGSTDGVLCCLYDEGIITMSQTLAPVAKSSTYSASMSGSASLTYTLVQTITSTFSSLPVMLASGCSDGNCDGFCDLQGE